MVELGQSVSGTLVWLGGLYTRSIGVRNVLLEGEILDSLRHGTTLLLEGRIML